MPTYPVKNLETGEKKELSMTISQYEEWRKENPNWDKDWAAGVAAVGEVGDWKDKLRKTKPGSNDVLKKVQQVPGSTVKTL